MALTEARTSHRHGVTSSVRGRVLSARSDEGGNRNRPASKAQVKDTRRHRNYNACRENSSNFSDLVARNPRRTYKLYHLFVNSAQLLCLYSFLLFIVFSFCLFSTTTAESQNLPLSKKPLANFMNSNDRVSSEGKSEKVQEKQDEGSFFSDETQQTLKTNVTGNIQSNENKNASTDTRRSRESRSLTWGEYIAKSSEAPAHHLYASTEAPLNYGHFSQPGGKAGQPESSFQHSSESLPNNQQGFSRRTSEAFGTHSRKLDLYGSGPTSEFINPNAVTSSPPVDDELLDKLAHYLLYGSEETKKAFSEGSYSTEDHDSIRRTDYDLGSEVDTDYIVNDNANRKDNLAIHSYDSSYLNNDEFHVPKENSNGNGDQPEQNYNTRLHTSTEAIDMKKIFKDLADLIEILPEHFEELDDVAEDRSGSEPHIDTVNENHNVKNFEASNEQKLNHKSESKKFDSENLNIRKEDKNGFLEDGFRGQTGSVASSTIRPKSVPYRNSGSQTKYGAIPIFYPDHKPSYSNSTTSLGSPQSPQYVRDLQTFFRTSSLSPVSENLDQVSTTTMGPFYRPVEHRVSSPKPPTSERPYERFRSTPQYPPENVLNFQTTTRPSIYSSVENTPEYFHTSAKSSIEVNHGQMPLQHFHKSSTENVSGDQREKQSLERFSSAPSMKRDSLPRSGSHEPTLHDDGKPLIFTSGPIFTSNYMGEDDIYTTVRPKANSHTTERFISSVETATQNPAMVQALSNSPHQKSIAPSENLSSDVEYKPSNVSDGEDQKKAQKRTLDLLYHMFVDPTTDEHGNRRNTLLEDVIKAIDNHIVGDVVALKEYSQSGKKGQSHFKENNGDFFKTLLESIGFDEPFMKSTVDTFSSVSSSSSSRERNGSRKPAAATRQSGTKRHVASSSKNTLRSVQQVRPQIRNSSEIISLGSNTPGSAGKIVGEPHVETLPSGDEFLLTDEFGKQQIVTIEDIVSSLTALDEAELSELLGENRRSDQDVERIIARESIEKQPLSKPASPGFKINNLIVVGADGKSESIPFDQIGMASRENILPTTTPPPVVIAAHHLLGDRVSGEQVEFNPTMQAAQHLFGLETNLGSVPKNSHAYENPAQPHPVYTKAPLRGKVLVTIPTPAENPMLAINHQSNLKAFDNIPGFDSPHSISSPHSLEAEPQRTSHEGLSGVHYRPAKSQTSVLPFDSTNEQKGFQSSMSPFPSEADNQGKETTHTLSSRLKAQEELQMKQKLALDMKIRTQLEQLQRLQNQLASTDAPSIGTYTEAPATAKPVNLQMIPRERIIDVSSNPMNIQPDPVRKVDINPVTLQQTSREAIISEMMKNKDFISSSVENKDSLLKALSQVPSSEVGNRRIEASTFRTPTPLISEESRVIKKNPHVSYIKPEHHLLHNNYRPQITVVENTKNWRRNFDEHFPHENAHQYAIQSGVNSKFHTVNAHQPSSSAPTHSLPHDLHFRQPPGLSKTHFRSHEHFHAPGISPSSADLHYSYEDQSAPDPYESLYQNVGNDEYLDIPTYGNNGFAKQIIEQEIDEEKREKFASKIYEQVVKSLPKPIHFEPTTTHPPVTERPQIFGFNLPNIFPMPHSHSNTEAPIKEKSDDTKDELKWNDPLGLLGLYDYLPFSKKRNEEKKSVIKVTTPKPVSPEKRLQQALEMGNVPPHVSKILVGQMKSKADGMGSTELVRSADRRQFDRVPQVRYRNVPNRRSYSTGSQVFQPRKNVPSRRRVPGSSRSYPSPLIRARKFGPPNPGSLVPGSVVKGSAGAQLKGASGYATHVARPQSSHFGVFSSEKEVEGAGPYEYHHGDSHASDYPSAEYDHHSGYYSEDEDHGYDESPEYDTYLVPLGTKGYKKVQPLFDLSLLLHNVKVKKIGEENESFSFPKIGDPSKFVNIYRPPPHYKR